MPRRGSLAGTPRLYLYAVYEHVPVDGMDNKREERPVATISTADFKNGMGLKINGKYYTIVEFQHVKPG